MTPSSGGTEHTEEGDSGLSSESHPRVAGVVLAFHPEEGIVHNVAALRQQVPHVFVVENSDIDAGSAASAIHDQLRRMDGVQLIVRGDNGGVGEGFNEGMRRALEAGFDYVWIFDQDSTVTPGMLTALLRYARTENVGIVGPALRAAATGRVYDRDRGVGAVAVHTLISSGSLFSAALLKDIGLHDADLFIDYVDHDISLRARAAGRTNYKVLDTLLDHRFGDSAAARLAGRRVFVANYSPTRLYYQSRNRLVLLRRFGPRGWFWDDARFTIKAWIKILLLERDRSKKIAAALRGTWHGLRRSPHAAGSERVR